MQFLTSFSSTIGYPNDTAKKTILVQSRILGQGRRTHVFVFKTNLVVALVACFYSFCDSTTSLAWCVVSSVERDVVGLITLITHMNMLM